MQSSLLKGINEERPLYSVLHTTRKFINLLRLKEYLIPKRCNPRKYLVDEDSVKNFVDYHQIDCSNAHCPKRHGVIFQFHSGMTKRLIQRE